MEPFADPAIDEAQSRRRSRGSNPRRYGFACLSCKARKSKCSGEQPVCAACRKSGSPCTWSAPVAEKQLQHATDRIRQLEQALRESQAPSHSQVPETGSITSPSTADDMRYVESSLSPLNTDSSTASNARQTATNLHFHVGRGDTGAVVYNGPTSRFHVGPLDENAVEDDSMQSTTLGSIAPSNEAQRSSHIETLRAQYNLLNDGCIASMHYDMHFERLGLDNDMCMRLLEIYWTWLQPLHNCVYRPLFLIDMAFGGQHYSDFLLLSILSLSARHLAEHDGNLNGVEKGEQLLCRARELLLVEISAPKPLTATIQGLLILGGRQCAMGKNSEGWLYTSMAIKMLEDIGLHLRIPDSKLVELERCTPVELEARKRLYNSAYIWEKTMCLALGRPPSLTQQPYLPSDILDLFDDSDEWTPVHAIEMAAQYVPQRSYNTTTFCAHTELHRITTDMMALFFTLSRETLFAEETRALEARLRTWYSTLPNQLRMDDTSQLSQSPPPHIVSLNVLFHALTLLLYRPSLASKNMGLSSHATQTCSAASKSILAILALYERTFPYRLMTYQVSYCVFTAATAQAYIMRHCDGELAKEAAMTLSSAMRILRHETKHTPGISGSLDTIRKQLMMGKPIGRTRVALRLGENSPTTSQNLEPGTLYTGAIAKIGQPVFPSNSNMAMMEESGDSHSQPVYEHDMDIVQEPYFGIGGIDTGAGFHPSVFPWTSADWTNLGDWMGCN